VTTAEARTRSLRDNGTVLASTSRAKDEAERERPGREITLLLLVNAAGAHASGMAV
jgi:hypothetical protein